MQYQHQINLETVKQTAVSILKAKGEWIEGQTLIHVTKLHIQQCQIYLIQINSVSSTMILSENWPKQQLKNIKYPVIMAFRADRQHSGRGQRQNIWSSPQGNLYLTLLMKLQFTYFPYLPIVAITNVFKTVKHFIEKSGKNKIVLIKWINDVVVDFQKVSGVLIKNQMVGQSLFTQIGTFSVYSQGIGINVKKSPSEIQSFVQSASNLEEQTGQKIEIQQICHKILQSFAETFVLQEFNDVKSQSKKVYEQNLAYLNRDVIIYDFKYDKVFGTGVFKGINEFGHAIISGYQKPFIQGRMKAHHLAI